MKTTNKFDFEQSNKQIQRNISCHLFFLRHQLQICGSRKYLLEEK